ncbi:MAG: CopG family transcriptional regulator [Acetivibrio ethanolgignens]
MANSDLIIKPKRAKGDDGYKTFSIRIKEETVLRLDDISAQTGHSRNELIGMFLEYAIEHCRVDDR